MGKRGRGEEGLGYSDAQEREEEGNGLLLLHFPSFFFLLPSVKI